jgi:hypothetical protein
VFSEALSVAGSFASWLRAAALSPPAIARKS